MDTPAEQSQEDGGGPAAARSAASGGTATTATAWPPSSSTSRRRCARGRSRSSTPRTWSASPTEDSGWYLQASLIVFLVSRFVMTYLLGIFRPTRLLFIMGALGVAFCVIAMFSENMVGLIAVVAISLSLSLMFPTIYGVALRGLGEDAKFGAAGLVMAILGGAIVTPIMGLVMDTAGHRAGVRRARSLPGLRRALRVVRPPHRPGGWAARGRRRPLGLRTSNDGLESSGEERIGCRTVAGITGTGPGCLLARAPPPRSASAWLACGDDEEQDHRRPDHQAGHEPVLRRRSRTSRRRRRGTRTSSCWSRREERRRQREPGGGARGHDRAGSEGHPHHPRQLERRSCPRSRRRARPA